jgi:hypothetical protein
MKLQQPDGAERHPPRGGSEHQQGQGGGHARRGEQQPVPRRLLGEGAAAGDLEPDERREGEREQQRCLDRQPAQRPQATPIRFFISP